MNVLSVFDGISCGYLALQRAKVNVDNYYSSEIDKWAIKVSEYNHPNIIQLGDINNWALWDIDWSSIDLVIGGSPCQSISNLGDKTGLKGSSGLFFQFLAILNHLKTLNPNIKFLLENVKGNKKALSEISELIGCDYIEINSNIVSAQNRKRVYWTNIEFELPTPLDIKLVDILEKGVPSDSVLSKGRYKWIHSESGRKTLDKKYAVIDPEKAQCLTARSDASWNSNYVTRGGDITRLTPIEYERLQTLPDNYTSCISNFQRYKSIGNGWTVDVISHIFKGLCNE